MVKKLKNTGKDKNLEKLNSEIKNLKKEMEEMKMVLKDIFQMVFSEEDEEEETKSPFFNN